MWLSIAGLVIGAYYTKHVVCCLISDLSVINLEAPAYLFGLVQALEH